MNEREKNMEDEEDNRDQEDNRRIKDLGWRRKNKIREGDKETSFRVISQVDISWAKRRQVSKCPLEKYRTMQ